MNRIPLTAVMSVPRLGFTDFYGHVPAMLAKRGLGLKVVTGVFWGACLQNGIMGALDDGAEGIITIDYDTVFKAEQLDTLLRLIHAYPEADAICPLQVGRNSLGILAGREPEVEPHELMREVIPINSGNFGLTFIRGSALQKMSLPWFHHSPGPDGRYDDAKTDDDIYFWKKFREEGFKSYLAPHVVAGHLELMVKWPDKEMQPIFQYVKEFHEHGPPGNCWG